MTMTVGPEFDARLAELAGRCRRQRLPCALLLARFAFDGAPDAALAEACLRRLRSRLRGDDEVHALGGLDFALLLRRVGANGCDAAAERLQRTCSAPDWLGPDGRLPRLSVQRLVPPRLREPEGRGSPTARPLASAACPQNAAPHSSSVPETPPAAPSPGASPAKASSPA
jgi:hypothetical protein